MNKNFKNTCKRIALITLVTLSFTMSACTTGTIVNDTSTCARNGSTSHVLDGCPSVKHVEVTTSICEFAGGTVGSDGKCH